MNTDTDLARAGQDDTATLPRDDTAVLPRDDDVPPAPPVPPSVPPDAGRKRRRKLIALAVLLVILAAFGIVAGWYATTRKPLTDLPGLTPKPRYLFSIYGVTHPLGVAVTPAGDRIYVTESDGERVVRVYNRTGAPIGTLEPPASTGTWHVPVYVAINPTNEEVYVSDRATAAIYVYDDAGGYLRAFEPRGDLGDGWAPLGLAFDAKGQLYVTDVRGSKEHRVLVFGADGSVQRALGATERLSFPNGVVVDPRGNITVSDSNNGQVLVFNPDGQVTAKIARGVGEGDLGLPRGTAIDDRGRLYVVDTSNHVIRIYRAGEGNAAPPTFIESFGEEGTLDGLFEYPNGIATDARSRIYITDRENNRVQVWSY